MDENQSQAQHYKQMFAIIEISQQLRSIRNMCERII